MKKLTFIILLFLPVFYSFVNSDSIIKENNVINCDTSKISEAKAYKMLYENQIKSNDAILKTIFYALGGLGTAVLLVFGSNWWFNDKKVKDVINEIDIKINNKNKDTLADFSDKFNVFSSEKTSELKNLQIKLQESFTANINELATKFNVLSTEKISEINNIQTKLQESVTENIKEIIAKFNTFSTEKNAEINNLQTKLQETATTNISDLSKKINEFNEKIRSDIKDDNRLLVSNYQELIKSYNDNLTQQITTLKDSNEEKIKLILKQIEENDTKNNERIKNESKELKRELLNHHAEIAFLKGNLNIALKAFIDFALFEFSIGSAWRFKYISNDIIKCLEKVEYIYSDELEALNSLAGFSLKEFPDETSKITLLFKDKPVRNLT